MADSCGNGYETSGFIKMWELFDYLSNYSVFKQSSAAYNSLARYNSCLQV
jgi:hypothetical protein